MGTAVTMLEYFEAHLRAEGQVMVFANMRGESAEAVAAAMRTQTTLGGLQGPTISPVYVSHGSEPWFAVNLVVRRGELTHAIQQLREHRRQRRSRHAGHLHLRGAAGSRAEAEGDESESERSDFVCMDIESLISPHLRAMEPYTPIVPFEVLSKQLGATRRKSSSSTRTRTCTGLRRARSRPWPAAARCTSTPTPIRRRCAKPSPATSACRRSTSCAARAPTRSSTSSAARSCAAATRSSTCPPPSACTASRATCWARNTCPSRAAPISRSTSTPSQATVRSRAVSRQPQVAVRRQSQQPRRLDDLGRRPAAAARPAAGCGSGRGLYRLQRLAGPRRLGARLRQPDRPAHLQQAGWAGRVARGLRRLPVECDQAPVEDQATIHAQRRRQRRRRSPRWATAPGCKTASGASSPNGSA